MIQVQVRDLRIDLESGKGDVVNDINFDIAKGEVLGVVGESGSGKTTVGLALLGHTRRGVKITQGSVNIDDVDVLGLKGDALRRIRGRVVSYVPQDPSASLNPAMRIGVQLREILDAHSYGEASTRPDRVREMMREVALPDDDKYLSRFPHELSGGQQQRIGLAMAFACRPKLIVLDEPTTGLDVTTQAHVLSTVRELAANHGVAALYVTHDLAVVATLAQKVAVMYAGRIVELGTASELFDDASHPYTRRLIAAIPRLAGQKALTGIRGRAPSPGARPPGCAFVARCDLATPECDQAMPQLLEVGSGHLARCIRSQEAHQIPLSHSGQADKEIEIRKVEDPVLALENLSASYGSKVVVHDINLRIARRECLAVVGESGSGKTTIARSIAGIHKERTGQVLLEGEALDNSARRRSSDQRRRIQYVFQNPYGSLNPRRTVGQIIRQPVDVMGSRSSTEARSRVMEMLERVSLPADYAQRYPDQLSGGERQRVAIARALVMEPSVLICDEVTSALDVSVQAAIVELLAGLQRDLGLAMVFVTHNLPLVRSIAQYVVVMSEGRVVEQGTAEEIMGAPKMEYTKRLLSDTPSLAAS